MRVAILEATYGSNFCGWLHHGVRPYNIMIKGVEFLTCFVCISSYLMIPRLLTLLCVCRCLSDVQDEADGGNIS